MTPAEVLQRVISGRAAAAIRSGGHCYETSTPTIPKNLIDLSMMSQRGILPQDDHRAIHVGAGATLGRLIKISTKLYT